ncbi:DUF2147 domain-containing protein [Rhizobium sp. S152]|uniref:DUF2147 domain-containing protein n=1 Tax=Rhizobium sp. S152 TaxID=3055038 RepID=UPI0025A99230|nr:DUF2147 domain-containing protein [Rhizobium sp. S152]MDM9625458.1 DUF2147 domain-containing protein [Rhizobium sp. S152]
MERLSLLAAPLALMNAVSVTSPGLAQDPVVGLWKTPVGTTAVIGECGKGFCITMKTGEHAGQTIGSFTGANGSFSGTITEPDSRKTFEGVLTLSGDTVKMRGCTMKVICRSLVWTRL